MMEQSRGDGSQGSRLSHQQPSNRERTSHPHPRGSRQNEPDHRRYDDRSRSRDTRRSHSRGSPSHRDYSNRSRSRDLTRSRPREEHEGKKRKRDENRASRWDEISSEERASKAFWTKGDTEEHRRRQQNEWDRVLFGRDVFPGQVPSDEQVAIIIAEAEASEERQKQRKLAQATEEDEKVARSLFWTEQEAANKEILKKHEHATRVFKEDQDRADARAKEEKQRRERAGLFRWKQITVFAQMVMRGNRGMSKTCHNRVVLTLTTHNAICISVGGIGSLHRNNRTVRGVARYIGTPRNPMPPGPSTCHRAVRGPELLPKRTLRYVDGERQTTVEHGERM